MDLTIFEENTDTSVLVAGLLLMPYPLKQLFHLVFENEMVLVAQNEFPVLQEVL